MALLECSVFEVFFGGARGGGKTDGMLGEWILHADKYAEHAIGLMLRRTRTELIETIERSRAIYSLLGWKYNETDKMWRATNGARLRFAYLERDADADLYQGHSYTRLYVEEIRHFPVAGADFQADGYPAFKRGGSGRLPSDRKPWRSGPSMGEGALYRSGAAGQPDHTR